MDELLIQKAENGDFDAQYSLVFEYANEANFEKAFIWYRKVLFNEQGCFSKSTKLDNLDKIGKLRFLALIDKLNKSFANAYYEFKQIVKEGCLLMLEALIFFADTEKNYDELFSLCQIGAEFNDARCQEKLAGIYADSNSKYYNLDLAIFWYQKALIIDN